MIGKHLHLLLRPMNMHLMILIGYVYHPLFIIFLSDIFSCYIYRNSMMFLCCCSLSTSHDKRWCRLSDMFLGYPHPTSLILLAGYGLSSVMGDPHTMVKRLSHGHDDWMIWLSLAKPPIQRNPSQSHMIFRGPRTVGIFLSFSLEKPMAFPQLR